MKKTIFRSLLAVTFIATLLLAGCQKDSVTLRARISHFGGNSKVYINSSRPTWKVGDSLWVNGSVAQVVSLATNGDANVNVPSAPIYRVIYPSNIVTEISGNAVTLNIPREQIYYETTGADNQMVQVVNAPMAAVTNSTTVNFTNLAALLAISINNNTSASLAIESVVVTSVDHTLPLCGPATVDNIASDAAYYVCATPTDTNYYSVKLVRRPADNSTTNPDLFTLAANASKTVYVYVPDHGTHDNYYRIIVNARNSNGPLIVGNTQRSSTGGNIERGQMASVPFDMRSVVAPAGAIDGKFTINGNGDQVYFAQGNLQWRPTINIANPGVGVWRIAQNQYDFIGDGGDAVNVITSSRTVYHDNVLCDNEKIGTDNYSGWIDLFGWATSGWDNTDYLHGGDSTSSRYHPYDYDNSTTNQWGCWNSDSPVANRYRYGPSIHYPTNYAAVYLQGSNANYDWGVYHSNPDNGGIYYVDANNELRLTSAQWRTLTYDEWKYIFELRPIEGNQRYSLTVYCTVPGFVLYPDDYIGQPVGSPITSIPSGCVFLPLAGFRNGLDVTVNSSIGYYWSSQSGGNGSASYLKASSYTLEYLNNRGTLASKERYLGYAVRLVTPVQ